VAIVPGGFYEDAPRVGVPGFGDGAATLTVPGGILARDQAKVGHQLPRACEPLEVDDLGQKDHGRQGVAPAEAPEPRIPIWLPRHLQRLPPDATSGRWPFAVTCLGRTPRLAPNRWVTMEQFPVFREGPACGNDRDELERLVGRLKARRWPQS
jgi:hypothetical protein